MPYLLIALAVLGAAILAYTLRKRAQWAQRPQLLCLACDAIAQPSRDAGKRLVCASCHAPGPVPPDSPTAVAHHAARTPPPADKLLARVWVPRSRQDDDITRYG